MKYQHVHFEGFGYALPDNVVTSAEIERQLAPIYERFNLHEGRLELMSGIRERRFWDEGSVPSGGSTLAGARALKARRRRSHTTTSHFHQRPYFTTSPTPAWVLSMGFSLWRT